MLTVFFLTLDIFCVYFRLGESLLCFSSLNKVVVFTTFLTPTFDRGFLMSLDLNYAYLNNKTW